MCKNIKVYCYFAYFHPSHANINGGLGILKKGRATMLIELETPALQAALEILEKKRGKLEEQITMLRGSITRIKARKPGRHSREVVSLLEEYKAAATYKPRHISAAGRARISETQRFRWAAWRQRNATQNQVQQ